MKDRWKESCEIKNDLNGVGAEPPVSQLLDLGDECVLAGEVGFDLFDCWEDVLFEAEGVFCDPGLG